MHRTFLRSLLLLGLLLAACGNADQTTQGAGTSSAAPSTVGEVTSSTAPSAAGVAVASVEPMPSPSVAPSASAQATPGPDEFVNPVIDQDFPDPDLVKVGDTYYAYATNAFGKNIQAASSTDLVTWQQLEDPLPIMPLWARAGLTWAPEVTTYDDGQTFVMYFTARDNASDKQCIGVATSDNPEGIFTDSNEAPFICQADQGGSIDASSFEDEDGTRYVLWKNDGNCCAQDTYLYIQKVSADGLTLEGEPTQLIKQDQFWEGNLVEAPTLWKHDGRYYLFYSANSYAGMDYATGYAVADNVLGPYTKPTSEPWLESTLPESPAAIGPGGQDIVLDDDGEPWLVYHSWDPTIAYRRMMLDPLTWNGDQPVVDEPDLAPQPIP